MGSSLQHARTHVLALATALVVAAACLASLAGSGRVAQADTGTSEPGTSGQFVSLPLTGIFDSAIGVNTPVAKVPANGSVTFQVAGKAGIPATGVSAVALNIWKRDTTAANGYLVVRPSDQTTTVGTLWYMAGEQNSTDDLVRLTSTGKLTVANIGSSPVDVRIAVRGYFLDASATQAATEYHPVTAAYLYDSRPGVGPADDPKTPLPSKTPITIQVTGKAGVPATGVDSVAINIAALGATVNGGLSLWADGEADPASSTLLYTAGENNNLTDVVRVGAGGRIRLINHGTQPINVSIAIRGYFKQTTTGQTAGAGFVTVEPKTLLRTDTGTGVPGGAVAPLAARASVTFTATSATSTPLQRISAVAGSITAYNSSTIGSLSITPTGSTEPKIGILNFAKDEVSQLTDIVRPGTDGKLTITNHSDSTVQIQFSIRGYFLRPDPQVVAKVVDAATGTEDLATEVTSDSNSIAVVSQPATEEDAGMTVDVPRTAEDGVTFTDANGTTVLGLPASGEATASPSGTIVFNGSEDGFSTAVQPTEDGLRALIHIDNENSPRVYNFPVKLPDGATMVVDDEDGSVGIIKAVPAPEIEGIDEVDDGTDPDPDTPDTVVQMLSRIEAPWAKDATGRIWPSKFTVEGDTLKLSVDLTPVATETGELASPVYPVVTDPAVKKNCGIITCSLYLSKAITHKIKLQMDKLRWDVKAMGQLSCTAFIHPLGMAACVAAIEYYYGNAKWHIWEADRRGGCFVSRFRPSLVTWRSITFDNVPLSNKYCYAK